MTTIYIVGNGAGSFRPKTSASATVGVWGGGQAGASSGLGGAGAGFSQGTVSLTAGTPIPFSLGAPGTTDGGAGADTWFVAAGTLIANGGGSATARIGATNFAGGTGGDGSACYGGGGGAGGPNGAGRASPVNGSPTAVGGTSGGGCGGGTDGADSIDANGVAGGNGFAGTGGAGGTSTTDGQPGGPGAGGGSGYGANPAGTGSTAGGAGGDDYDNGGGGGGAEGRFGTGTHSGAGGTPGGGGGGAGDTSFGRGGYGLIKISYTGTDQDQILVLGSITSVHIPSTWGSTATGECWAGGGGGGTGAAASGKGGGSGGGYSSSTISVTPGGTLTVAVGPGGPAQTTGTNSSIGGTTVVANAGIGTSTVTGAAQPAAGTGTVANRGGAGGNSAAASTDVGGGGGGAAGSAGNGVVGAAGTTVATTGAGGAGDNGSGGAGGATAGAANTAGNPGISNSLGGGGGSGSGKSSTAKVGGAGGFPGGGGGGGGGGATSNTGGAGGNGLVALTNIPAPLTLSWLNGTTSAPTLRQVQPPSYPAWTFPQSNLAIDWQRQFIDPYLVARLPTALRPTETHPIVPPALGIIGWYVALSTPPAHLKPNTLPVAVSSPSFFSGFLPIVPPAPTFGYYTLFGNPPPPLPSRAVYMPPATGPPPNYAFDRWFQEALSEPPAYLRRPSLNTAIQQNHVEPITAALPPAPLISNIHPGLPGWTAGPYTLGQRFSNGGNAYQCIQAGNSTVPPVGTGSFIQSVPASGFSSGFSSGWGNPADTAAFKWLSHIDYTSLQAWANDLMTNYSVTGLPAPVTALVWNDSTLTAPLNQQHLFIQGIPNNGVPILITCAPGESIRDSSGNPLAFDASKGVAFVAPTIGAELNSSTIFYFDVANVTIDGFQFRDLNQTGNSAASGTNANLLLTLSANASNFTVQNSIIDGFHLLYTAATNTWLKNCLLINEQTQQATSGSPLWPVKWDFGATGGAINCTAIGFSPTGICSMFTTLGGIGQAQMINTTAFGLGNAFFAQNTGGSISADHCALDQSSLSGTAGLTTTDLGGNLLNLVATNQFISAANDFRLKAISGLIDRGRADLADLPSAQDFYRTPRPQGLGWDIGAVEFVFSLTWLGSQPQPGLRPAGLPVALRTQEPPFISIQRAEVTSLDRWYQPFSRLIPPRQGLAAHLQLALIQPVTIATSEITTADRWLANYPAIVRGLTVHPSLAPSHVEPVSPIFVQDVSRLQWNASWPRSVAGRFLHPSQVPFATVQPISPIFREITTLDRWYQSLSVPQLWRVYYREQASPTEPFIPIKIVPVEVTVSPLAGGVIVTGFGPLIKRLRGN